MLVKKCQRCETIFEPKTYRHLFCSRICFMLSYRKNMKESKYPLYKCTNCGKITQLNFHPLMSKDKWESFKCECKKIKYL